MNSKISIVPCDNYETETVQTALLAVLQPLGGLAFVKPGMTVVIKTNLVSAMKPETAATTHPSLLCALTKMLIEKGAKVLLGDSPGGLYSAAYVNRIYHVTGMDEVAKAGAELNQDFSVKEVSYPQARVLKSFTYTAYLDRADVIINFCKLKSHGMMGMSAAAKNMFGVIPGVMKPEYHYRFPKYEDFADMLVDLDEYFHPRLNIVDAVVGMEGNGPTAGIPKPIGALIASENPHAADLLCAKLIGLSPKNVPILDAAIRRGLVEPTLNQLEIVGEIQPYVQSDYKIVAEHHSLTFVSTTSLIGRLVSGMVSRCLNSKPKVHLSECVGCNVCGNVCPANAITMVEKKASIDREKCIRCFCCQEFCPKGAMKVKRTAIARLMGKL